MIKKLFIPLVMLCVFAACKSKSAFNYSQDIVKKEQSLVPEITATEEKVANFLKEEKFDSIAAAGERMEKLVDVKLNELKDLPAPDAKEATAFKDATLDYFRFIKSLYTGYKELGMAKTADAREQVMESLRSLINKKNNAIQAMQGAQKKFAEANGFKLEN